MGLYNGDFSLMHINPALLNGNSSGAVSGSYINFLTDANMGFTSGAYKFKNIGTFGAGISIRNLGSQITTFYDESEPLPLNISIGISKKPETFPLQLILTFKQLNSWDLRTFGGAEKPKVLDNLVRHVLFGGEAKIAEVVYLRLGYDHYLHKQTKTGGNFDLAGFGFGFEVKNIIFDFNRNSYSKLGGITRLSIKTNLL
ncbi:MAG TPA: hypothetical protein VFM80_10835 [Gracilimonas sp.]|uniref:hypothetical protein n=1 Tax=Gracilimonas sp. TaxID=1974203 RepID=UPI002DA0FD30|nr:hypothetical protein [Gracilimonas sp.]